jgi:transcriptional regulator with XRE-family HTH domain
MSTTILRFGEKLKQIRERNHLTLKQMADRLDLRAHGYISELEAGKKCPSVELVLKVARLFDATTDSLLKDELDLDFD